MRINESRSYSNQNYRINNDTDAMNKYYEDLNFIKNRNAYYEKHVLEQQIAKQTSYTHRSQSNFQSILFPKNKLPLYKKFEF